MLQAEIGSATVTSNQSLPSRGHRLADFTLSSSQGAQVSLYDYRGRSNLVLFFAARPETSPEKGLLQALTEHYGEIGDADSEVIAVAAAQPEKAEQIRRNLRLPFPVWADPDLHIHNLVGASGAQGIPAAAFYVTDRFLEVYAAWRSGTGDQLPDVSEVLSWLTYLDSQCPECAQAEWPVDE